MIHFPPFDIILKCLRSYSMISKRAKGIIAISIKSKNIQYKTIFLLHLRFKDFHFMFHYVQTIIGSKRVKYLTLLTLLDLTCNYNSKALEEFDINHPEGCLIVELNMQRNEMSSSIHSFVDFYALSKRSYSI